MIAWCYGVDRAGLAPIGLCRRESVPIFRAVGSGGREVFPCRSLKMTTHALERIAVEPGFPLTKIRVAVSPPFDVNEDHTEICGQVGETLQGFGFPDARGVVCYQAGSEFYRTPHSLITYVVGVGNTADARRAVEYLKERQSVVVARARDLGTFGESKKPGYTNTVPPSGPADTSRRGR